MTEGEGWGKTGEVGAGDQAKHTQKEQREKQVAFIDSLKTQRLTDVSPEEMPIRKQGHLTVAGAG